MCMRVGRVPFKGMCLDQGFTKNKHQALEKKKHFEQKILFSHFCLRSFIVLEPSMNRSRTKPWFLGGVSSCLADNSRESSLGEIKQYL